MTAPTHEELIKDHPILDGVVGKHSWEYIKGSDKKTINVLKKFWVENLRKNISSKRYKRHGGLNKDYLNFGRNKAVVCIGAGPSLKNNLHVLKRLHDLDGLQHPDYRNFIFIASNHMLKPLLKEGIIPDFVFLTDASEVVLDQLTKDVPEEARYVTLLAGLQCSPKVLKKWERQGREIRFYLPGTDVVVEEFRNITKEDPEGLKIIQGGNIMNCCWGAALKILGSTVFMSLGNDLSYPIRKTYEERKEGYYVDGDYSTNAATGRDEARSDKAWMGYKLSKSNIISLNAEERYNVELDRVATNGTLWVYKTWLEAQVTAASLDAKFTYYNCSEGGILGVMHKEDEPYNDIKSWYLLDSVAKRFRTRTFEDAISEFLKAKDILRWQTQADVRSATALAL
jgi:hypothetical protein